MLSCSSSTIQPAWSSSICNWARPRPCGAPSPRAEEHHRHVLCLYDAAAHQPSVLTLGSDPSVGALAVSALRLWLTGWPEQAIDHAVRAQARAEMLAHMLSLMVALTGSVQIRLWRGECTAAFAVAQRLVDMGHEHDFVLYEAMGMMFQGSVWVQDGALGNVGLPLVVLLGLGLRVWRRRAAEVRGTEKRTRIIREGGMHD